MDGAYDADEIVLIFVAFILSYRTSDLVVKNLADFDSWVNSHRLDRKHFQRPVSTKPDVAKSGTDMDKQPQSGQ